MMQLTLEDMPDFARGAAFLGTGGGGAPHLGQIFCETAIRRHGAPQIIPLEDLDDDAAIYGIAMMGAPTVIVEKLLCGDDALLAIEKLEKHTGRKADAIMALEVGGINSSLPVAIAAMRGLPVVDADGMGRAFPEIQMTTFNVYGVPLCPYVITDEHMESTIVEARNGDSGEAIGRALAMQMGLAVMISAYPMTGRDAQRTAVGGTMSLAVEIGRAITAGRRNGDPVAALIDYLRTTTYYNQAKLLFDGKIVDLVRETTRGFAIGKCTLAALDGSDSTMEIMFQNENLVARQNGMMRAIVPDLVCIVDRETAEPITTEGLKYGLRVKVIGTSVAPSMRTPEALSVFGPKAFGVDEPFVPIEEIA